MATSEILTAREKFREGRTTYLWLFIGWNLFSLFFLFSAGFLGFLLWGLGLAIILYSAKQPVRFFCPTCEAHTGSRADWSCEFCRFKHRVDDIRFSFIYPYSAFDRCKACGKEPHYLSCWKCNAKHFFTPDSQRMYEEVRERLNPTPPPDPRDVQELERDAVKHQITMARLNRELEDFLKLKSKVEKSPKEALEQDYAQHKQEKMGAYEILRREEAANAVEFKDDPEMLKRANASVREWARMRGL